MTLRSHGRSLLAILTVPLLVVGLAACGGSSPDDAVQGAASDNSSPTAVASAPTPPPTTAQAEPSESAKPTPLSHDAALAAGLAGDSAIKCVYTFDAQELEGMKLVSTSGWVTDVADIYLNAGAVYWDIPQEDDVTSHVLGLDDATYAWKVPGDGQGAMGEDPTGQAMANLDSRLEGHTSGCERYTGPLSIFDVPGDITFTDTADTF